MLHKTPRLMPKKPIWHKQLRLLPLCVAGLLLSSLSVLAITPWQWIDSAGRKVYSDTPPPPSVPAKNILKQPGAKPYAPSSIEPSANQENPVSGAAKPKAAETPDDKSKRDADKTEAAQRKAQEEKNAAMRSENCQRAQTSLATLQSGVRLVTTNAQGEPVVMDDTQREQESQRLRGIIAENCR